jgi:hypothetical protein
MLNRFVLVKVCYTTEMEKEKWFYVKYIYQNSASLTENVNEAHRFSSDVDIAQKLEGKFNGYILKLEEYYSL